MESQISQVNEMPKNVEQKIEIDEQTAFNLKTMEFDKLIAEAEANVAELKKQKTAYIYDTHVNSVVVQHQIKQQQLQQSPPPPPQIKEDLVSVENPQKIPLKKEKEKKS